MANIPRAPIFTRYWGPYRLNVEVRGTPLPLLLGVVPVPFSLSDWPLPIQPARVYAEARRADIQLLHSVQPPTSQTNWPPPIQPYIVYATSYGTGLQLLGVGPVPFSQNDWPPPKLALAPTSSQTWIQQGIKIVPVGPPISQTDWPVPIQPPVVYAMSYGSTALIIPPIIVPKPFGLSDWPMGALFIPYRVYSSSYSTPATLIPPIPPVPPLLAGTYRALADIYLPDERYIEAGEIFVGPPGWIPSLGVDPIDNNAIQAYWSAGPAAMGTAEHMVALSPWGLWDRRTGQITPARVYWQRATGYPDNVFILTGAGAALGPKSTL